MTEQDIMRIIQQKRSLEAEYAIMRDCLDELFDADQTDASHRYAILKRKLDLIKHWLGLLPPIECEIVELHLVCNKPWSHIPAQVDREGSGAIACDERTLQRQQAKALARINDFMERHFASSHDNIID